MSLRVLLPTLLVIMVSTPSVAEDAAWTLLFDGSTLDGWSSQVKGDVKAEDGEIRILSMKNLWLVHESKFDDFELVVEAKMPNDTYNSGIGFRCEDGKKVKGYQCEIDHSKSGMIYAIGSGWVWPHDAEQRSKFEASMHNNFDNTKWNTFRIRCEGDHIQVWINEKQITDVRDDRFAGGCVALQHHGKGGLHRFRNVRIRSLDRASARAATDEPANATPSSSAFTIVSKILHDEALARAHDVELSGDLAFVPGKGGSTAIVNIANPAKPELLWFKHDPQGTPDSETVLPVGRHLLLGTQDFLTLDITDPKNPLILKKISDRPQIDRINGMIKFGDYAIAANKSGYIDAFDVSNMDQPTFFGAVETKEQYGLSKPHDVDQYGDHVVIVDPADFAPPLGRLGIFRVAKDGKVLPTDQWTLVGKTEGRKLIGANRVQISGCYAFVGGSLSPKGRVEAGGDPASPNMTVVDISDPSGPQVVANLPFADLRGPNGMTIVGKVAFYAGGQTICAVDISDPLTPVTLASQSFPRFKEDAEKTDNYHDLVYRDGYLFVSAQTDNGFLIFKVNDKQIRQLANEANE